MQLFESPLFCSYNSRSLPVTGSFAKIKEKYLVYRKNSLHLWTFKNKKNMKTEEILLSLEAKHPGEKEYLQAVKEVLISIEDVYNEHP